MSRNEWEHKFHIGNVIESPEGSKWIVSEVRDHGERPVLEAISFDSENCSAVQLLEDHDDNRHCACETYGPGDEYEGNDPECTDCHGTGTYVVHVKGWKRSKVLAYCVQDYIISKAKKAFGL